MKIYYAVEYINYNKIPRFNKVFLSSQRANDELDSYLNMCHYYGKYPNMEIVSEDIEFVGRNVYVVETYCGFDYNLSGTPNVSPIYDILKYSKFQPYKSKFQNMKILSDSAYGSEVFYDSITSKETSHIKKFRVDRLL